MLNPPRGGADASAEASPDLDVSEEGSAPMHRETRAFRAWLEDRNYAAASVRIYLEYVERAIIVLGAAGVSLIDAEVGDLYQFWTTLPTTSSSRNQCRKALMAYYRADGRKRGEPADELPALPEPNRLPRPVDELDFRRLIDAAVDLGGIHEVVGLMLAYTGCRFGELRAARWDQFELRSATPAWFVEGKGSGRRGKKQRRVPLHARLVPVLTTWKSACGSPAFLFPSLTSADGVVAPSTLRKVVYALSEHAGLDRVIPHRYRHTVGTVTLAATRDLRAVQELLGHANAATTQKYTLVAPGRLQEAVDTLPV